MELSNDLTACPISHVPWRVCPMHKAHLKTEINFFNHSTIALTLLTADDESPFDTQCVIHCLLLQYPLKIVHMSHI